MPNTDTHTPERETILKEIRKGLEAARLSGVRCGDVQNLKIENLGEANADRR